jgi:hypothetical protein
MSPFGVIVAIALEETYRNGEHMQQMTCREKENKTNESLLSSSLVFVEVHPYV